MGGRCIENLTIRQLNSKLKGVNDGLCRQLFFSPEMFSGQRSSCCTKEKGEEKIRLKESCVTKALGVFLFS